MIVSNILNRKFGAHGVPSHLEGAAVVVQNGEFGVTRRTLQVHLSAKRRSCGSPLRCAQKNAEHPHPYPKARQSSERFCSHRPTIPLFRILGLRVHGLSLATTWFSTHHPALCLQTVPPLAVLAKMNPFRRIPQFLVALALLHECTWLAHAQETPSKPGIAHQRLADYVGRWRFSQDLIATPFAPAGKGTKKSKSSLTLGKLFLEERGEGKGPDGDYQWLTVTAYDPDKHQYQQFTFDNRGFSSRPDHGEVTLGTEKSGIWTWTWDEEANGKTYHCQAVDSFAPDRKSYRYTWRYSEDGQHWKPWLTGVATRR